MNNKKFCFITCVNNQELYNECLYYINNLNVPKGYEVEILSIENAESIASGYNNAMRSSDAKYKIYLHQDVLLINKNVLYEIIDIFSDENIGMIGVCGSQVIGTDGAWWNALDKYKFGKIYEYREYGLNHIQFSEINEKYKEVQAIDGVLMITQYDIPWREDIIDGWHFYDLTQSLEFIRNSYSVVVPKQNKAWCLHDSGLVSIDNYDDFRKIFLNEYGKELFPLVSILIPTYNRPEYFKLALESAINQTYPNIEIIVGDDSTNNDTEELIKDYMNKYNNITYYHNKESIGQYDNANKLLNMCNGRYVNFLMDDDLFALNKIEKMMHYFINYKDKSIAIVTSNRMKIDEKGNEKEAFISNMIIGKFGNKMFGREEVFDCIVEENINIIGGQTNVLFDKSKLQEEFGIYNSRRYKYKSEWAAWVNLLKDNNLILLEETLSYSRDHKEQQSKKANVILGELRDYIGLLLISKEDNIIKNDISYVEAMKQCFKYAENISEKYEVDEETKHYIKTLESKYNEMLSNLPLVSVIITTYNTGDVLRKTIDSILNQTYKNIELIIVDDASTDNTKDIILSYDDKRIRKILLDKNRHVCYSGNVGFKEAKGKYVAHIGHDDLWHKSKIEKQVEFLEDNKSFGVCFTAIDIIDENEQVANHKFEFLYSLFVTENLTKNEWTRKLLIEGNFLCAPSALIRKDYLDEVGYYKYGLIQLQDYDLWIRMVSKADIHILEDKLTYYRRFTEEDKNLSSSTYEKQNRSCHEFQWIQYKNIWNMPVEKFRQVFIKDIKCKDIVTEKEAMCEKAFLLWKMRNCYAEKIFLEILEDEECRHIFENKYNFELKDFYKINTESMLFDNSVTLQVLALQNQLEEYQRNKYR